MSAFFTLPGTGCSEGTLSLRYPNLAAGEQARGHSACLYVASNGEGTLIYAGPNIREQLIKHGYPHLGVSASFTQDNTTTICGRTFSVTPIAEATAIPIKRLLITHTHDDHINGITFLVRIPRTNNAPLDTYGSLRTMEYLTSHFGFVFSHDPKALKLNPITIPCDAEYKLDDGTVLSTKQVRHGRNNSSDVATIFGLPGMVYAPDISHATPDVIDFIVACQPKALVLNCCTFERMKDSRKDDFPHLGVEEFLHTAAGVCQRSSQTKMVISTHMDRRLSNQDLQPIFDACRDHMGVPQDVQLLVGYDGMRVNLETLHRVSTQLLVPQI